MKRKVIGGITFLMEYGLIVLLCLGFAYAVDYTIRYIFLYILIQFVFGHYRIRTNLIWEEIRLLMISHICFYFASLILIPLSSFTNIYLFRNTCITILMFVFAIILARFLRIMLREQFVDRVLIVGTGEHARALQQISISNRFTLTDIVGFVDVRGELIDCCENSEVVVEGDIYSFDVISDVIDMEAIDQVVVAEPMMSKQCMDMVMQVIHNRVKTIKYLPQTNGIVTFDSRVEDYDGILVISSSKGDVSLLKAIVKRVMDIIGGLFGCLMLIPLTVYVGVVNRRNGDHNPIFFTQERIGRDGKMFKMYKYRTMVPNAEKVLEVLMSSDESICKEYQEHKKLKDDPRITKAGQFLREKSLDEFPQLLNVVKGQMSLVGPRPYLPREKEDMGIYYDSIIKSKPGITGMWQSHGRSEVGFVERCKLDEYYYHNWNMWLDMTILIKTAKVVVYGNGAV